MVLSKFALSDKVAIVTGSGSGIGKAIALAFAEAGADVVVAGMNIVDKSKTDAELGATAGDIRAQGRKALVVPMDARVSEQVDDLVKRTLAEFGTIGILVNNVGATFPSPLVEISESGWDAVIRECLKTTFLCTRAAGKVMIAQKKGCVINISSMGGRQPSPNQVHYGAAKAAIISMTRSLAVEWGPYQIRVNSIAPGMIKTLGIAYLHPHDFEAHLAEVSKRSALGRPGLPEEVASVAVFLASDAASYVTGQTINVNGGEKVSFE